MRLSVRHELRFAPPEATGHAVQHVLATPRDTRGQKVLDWSIKMPGFDEAAKFTDAYGNIAHLVSQTDPSEEMFIAIEGVVETIDCNGVLGRIDTDPSVSLFKRLTAQTRPNGHLVNRLKAQQKAGTSTVEVFHWLMNVLYEATSESEDEADTDPPEIVAEDHAHVFVAALRGIDIPARFVTGYVLEDEIGPARFHAWAEAYDTQLGWIGFDPSTNLCPTPHYVRLAVGLDADSTTLVRMVPVLEKDNADVVRVAQVMVSNQQQQQ